MATNVTVERIELTAVDKFSAVIGQAQAGFKQLGSSIDTVKGALAAVGVTLGAGAVVSLYHDLIKANAALDDMAESTGASVENLSKLQTVAKIGGRDFEGLTGQLGKMIKGLKSSDEEGQKASYALRFLGIEAKDGNGRFRDTAEILGDVAKALAKYEDGGNKVALVQDILGKGAERYLPLLKDMAEEGEQHARVTAEQARQAEVFEKNLNRMKLAVQDTRRAFAIELTPGLVDFTNKLLAAYKATGNFISGLVMVAGTSTNDIAAGIREVDRRIEVLESRLKFTDRVGAFGLSALSKSGIGTLQNRREYLLAVQRQQALAGLSDSDLDVRDLRLRQKSPLDYATPPKRSDAGLEAARAFVRQLAGQVAERQTVGPMAEFEKLDVQLEKIKEKFPEIRHEAAGLIEKLRELAVIKKGAEDYAAELAIVEQRIEGANEAFTQFWRQNQLAKRDLEFQISMVGKLPHEQRLAERLRQIEIERNRASSSVDPRAPNAAETVRKINEEAERATEAVTQLFGTMREKSRDAMTGFELAVKSYLDGIGDMASQTGQVMGDALRGLEDVLLGVRSAGDAARQVALGVGRILIRQNVTGKLAEGINDAAKNTNWKNLFGFAEGGDFTVAGGGGTDSQLVAFRATPGEQVSVRTPGQSAGGDSYFIDARGADRRGFAQLAAAIRSVNGSIEQRAVSAWRGYMHQRGYATP